MHYVKHSNIDKEKWDQLVRSCVYPRIYLLSWYLDAACPGWDAIVWGDYECAISFEVKRLLFLKRIGQPLLVQQTGLFWQAGFHFQEAFLQLAESRFAENYFSFTTTMHQAVDLAAVHTFKGYRVAENRNFILHLGNSYSFIQKGFNTNRKRNLKKALQEGWQCETSLDFESALEMYRQNQAVKQHGLKKKVYEVLKRIYKASVDRSLATLYVCRNSQGHPLAYGLFVRFDTRIYYLFGAMNELGRQNSALSVIFDHVIEKFSEQELFLDFEGGNLEGIGKYFASFGATEEMYHTLYYSKAAVLKTWVK